MITMRMVIFHIKYCENLGRRAMEIKPRILYLQKILLERINEENLLSTTQLINILNDEYGISAYRTTVTKDIAALQKFEIGIV